MWLPGGAVVCVALERTAEVKTGGEDRGRCCSSEGSDAVVGVALEKMARVKTDGVVVGVVLERKAYPSLRVLCLRLGLV